MPEREDGVHEIATLLAWYANGTLEASEARRVEEHLAGCVACREQVQEWRRIGPPLTAAVERRPAPPADLFAAVRARIDAERAPRAAPREPWWERLAAAAFGVLPVRLAPAIALAVIVLQLGALAVVGTVALRSGSPDLVTQSGPAGRRSPAPGTVRLRVAFQPGAPEADLRTLLQRLDARIVDGPTAAGFYVVETPAGGKPVEETLRSFPALVRFVEPLPS